MTVTPPATDYVATATALVRTYCGWHIAPEEDATFTLDGSGASVLVLPTLHLVDVTSVTENGALLADADFSWSASGWLERSGYLGYPTWSCAAYRWTGALRGVVVEATHGYAAMPLELQSVIDTIAARLVDNPNGLEQITVGPFSEKYATGGSAISSDQQAVLDDYALPRLA